jgi:hypothetical protein
MGAGIEVAWVDERGNTIEVLGDLNSVIAALAMSRWPKLVATACLRFVDPWGDAVFNQTQIPVLLDELRIELAGVLDGKHEEHLLKLVLLVEKAQNQTHTYIKFIGD